MAGVEPDPGRGDYDEELADLDPRDIQIVEASTDRQLVVQFTLGGDDAAALQEIARIQGDSPSGAVRSLIRAAAGHSA